MSQAVARAGASIALGIALALSSFATLLASSHETGNHPERPGAWDSLPDAPWGSTAAAVAYTGTSMVVVDLASGRAVSYDPSARSWEDHPGAPVQFDPASPFVWSGSELFIFDRYDANQSYGYDPVGHEWRRLAPSPLEEQWVAALDGDAILAGNRNGKTASFDIGSGTWRNRGDVAPATVALERLYSSDAGVLAETRPIEGGPVTLSLFDSKAQEWTGPAKAPGAIHGEGISVGSAIVYPGAGSRFVDESSNARFDTSTMQWELVDWSECPVLGSDAVWTGDIVVGGIGNSAIDPNDGQCYVLPEAGVWDEFIGDSGRSWYSLVWTGEEVVFWSGAYEDTSPPATDGISFKPSLAGAVAARDEDQNDGLSAAQLYALLDEQAAAGSQEAVEARDAVDAYLGERGLTLEDMPPPEQTAERISDGMVALRLEGLEPWNLTIRNDTEVRDAGRLAAYRDLRHAALRSIAGSTPGREIEVAVTPDAFVGIPELLEALAWDGAVGARADVWRGGDWVMEVGTQADAGDRLRPRLEGQVSSALDLHPGLRLDDLDLTVRQLRLRLPAGQAAEMVEADGVLLVDPLTDVLDRFADRAVLVELANAPDVFRDYAGYALGRELVPGGSTPELQTAD